MAATARSLCGSRWLGVSSTSSAPVLLVWLAPSDRKGHTKSSARHSLLPFSLCGCLQVARLCAQLSKLGVDPGPIIQDLLGQEG